MWMDLWPFRVLLFLRMHLFLLVPHLWSHISSSFISEARRETLA
jgi:hypothetical protein